jgi:hypothetical protein
MQVARNRRDWCERAGFPPRVCMTVGSYDGTSDDSEGEIDLDETRVEDVFLRKRKPGRSMKWTWFVEWVDSQIEAEKKSARTATGKRKSRRLYTRRRRIAPREPAEPFDITDPIDVTADWYDKAYFNEMPITVRHKWHPGVASLPNDKEEIKSDRAAFKWMSDQTWMDGAGAKILEGYAILTKEEVTGYNADVEEEDGDIRMSTSGPSNASAAMNEQQRAFADGVLGNSAGPA